MIYNWYKIINYDDFIDMGLPSYSIDYYLENVGLKTFLITRGNYVSILYDDVFLSCNLNRKNPFEFDGYAIYIDDGDNIWFGIKAS